MSDKKKFISDNMDEKMVVDTESKTEDEFKKLDTMKILTSNEILDNVQIFDSTVEIVGYVDGIETSRKVGEKQQYTVFKFYINNNNGRRVQVIVWNDDIKHIEPNIELNHIIHLDGVQARIPKNSRFNNGNVPYELQIRSNTVLTKLGKFHSVILPDVEPERIAFCDVINTSTRVELEGYIKSNFGPIYNSVNKKIGCGSITDGQFKLEVHILDFDQDEYELMKGDKVKIIGEMKNTVNPPCFIVESLKDVRKIKGRLPLTSILSVNQMLTRKRAIESLLQEDPKTKKAKQD